MSSCNTRASRGCCIGPAAVHGPFAPASAVVGTARRQRGPFAHISCSTQAQLPAGSAAQAAAPFRNATAASRSTAAACMRSAQSPLDASKPANKSKHSQPAAAAGTRLGLELHLGRLEGVVGREVDGHKKHAPRVGRVAGPHDRGLPALPGRVGGRRAGSHVAGLQAARQEGNMRPAAGGAAAHQ